MTRHPLDYIPACLAISLLIVGAIQAAVSLRNALPNTRQDEIALRSALDYIARRNKAVATDLAGDFIANPKFPAAGKTECFYWLMQNDVREGMPFTELLALRWFNPHWLGDGGCAVGLGFRRWEKWHDPTVGLCTCFLRVDFLPNNGEECMLRITPASCDQLRRAMAGAEPKDINLPIARVTEVRLLTRK